MRGVDLGTRIANNARGQAFDDSRPRLALVTSITNWETAGIRATFPDTGEVIACEARGAGMVFDIAVDDYVWVERISGGKQNKWRISGFAESAGVFVPTVRTVSLPTISSLDASDGDPANVISIDAGGATHIGDTSGVNEVEIAADGTLALNGTAKVTQAVTLPLETGGGTCTTAVYNGSPTLVFDTDGETVYATVAPTPYGWDGLSDMTIVLAVVSEGTETAADRVSFTGQVTSYIAGSTVAATGQAVAVANTADITQDVVTRATGAIDFDEGTYPIQTSGTGGDCAVIRILLTVNLDGANEPTGPLHVLGWWVEFTMDRLGG